MSEFEAIEVMRNGVGPFPGVRLGRVAAYDFPLGEASFVRPGLLREDRAYLLLDEGIQLSCRCNSVQLMRLRLRRTWILRSSSTMAA